jgi:hypothetical protein
MYLAFSKAGSQPFETLPGCLFIRVNQTVFRSAALNRLLQRILAFMPDQTGATFSCQSCAASLQFKSAASYCLVCPDCHRLHYQPNQNRPLSVSKLGPVLEDMSLIRLQTRGAFGDRPFEVIGRLQYLFQERYRNHWYIRYADDTTGWLGDWDGHYSLFQPVGELRSKFDRPSPGKPVQINNVEYRTEQIDTSRQVLGEGELGRFYVNEDKFITLEFYTTEAQLALANIFTDKMIETFTGQYLDPAMLNFQDLRQHHDWA